MKRTKIVCTIGPASRGAAVLERLMRAGMDVARLNFSHGTQEEHGSVIRLIRETAERLDKPIAILQDLAGPKIRIGEIRNGPVRLEAGHEFVLTNREVPGDEREVSLTYPDLPRDVSPGDTLLLSDGALELTAERVTGTDIVCRVVIGGDLSSHKGINLPVRSIAAPILTAKDVADLAFGLGQGVDFVALSFVRSAADVGKARAEVRRSGRGDVPLVAKIEKHEALARIDDIIEAVDAVMVARGDMGVEIPIEQVPRMQKMIIEKANRAGRPVITATQMLKSMVESPRPTRAEVTDVANAILDGSDAVMLSEESAVGAYPVEAADMLARVARETESVFPHRAWGGRFDDESGVSVQQAAAHGAVDMAERVHAAAIVTFTLSGSTTRAVARHRPARPVIAVTNNPETYRRLALVWGAVPLMAPDCPESEIEPRALALAVGKGLLRCGDRVVITAGVPLHIPGITNLIKIVTVE